MQFTFNIHTDSNENTHLLHLLLANSVTKQQLRIGTTKNYIRSAELIGIQC